MVKRGVLLLSIFSILLLSLVSAINIDPEVLSALESNPEVSVIVNLKSPSEIGIQSTKAEQIKTIQDEVLSKLTLRKEENNLGILENNNYDLDLKHRYSNINGFSGKITIPGLNKLKKDNKTNSITLNRINHIFLSDSVPLINADSAWDITINGTNINGTGQTACVIDTGIDYTHLGLGGSLGNKVLSGYDFYNDDSDPMDDNNHGTHVAGIIASTNNTYRGVAPGANLIAMKVCNAGGSCPDADVLAGIEWCIDNSTRYNISVISISLGGGVFTNYCDNNVSVNPNYASLINQAVGRNISVIVATGNTDTACTGGATTGIAAPSCVLNATRITASSKSDSMAAYACRHANFLDMITAPGSSITSLNIGGGTTVKSGTSMATPHVSGAAILMHQYWTLAYNQAITPQQIEDKLKITSKIIDDTAGTGLYIPRINVLAALQPYINFTSTSPANATTISVNHALINITSDVNLSTALLEWNYNNGTITNFTMNKSTSLIFYYNLSGLSNTNYTYKVYGNDSANTFGVSEQRILYVDQTPPNITFNRPTNNSYWNSVLNLNILISNLMLDYSNYTLTNSSGSIIQYNFNSSIAQSNFTWTDLINLSNITFTEGNYSLNIFANDSRSNSASQSINLIIDKTIPLLFAVNRTPETIHNNDTVYFTINTTDLYLNNSAIYLESNFSGNLVNHTMSLETGNKFNFTLSGISNLTNQRNISYRFYALDYARNVNASENYNFIVQNRAPINLNVTTPLNGSILELANSTIFQSSAADPDLDNLTYTWNFNDSSTINLSQNITHSFNTTGNFTIFLNVSDGYNSSLINITLIINDTQAPTINFITYDSSVHLQQDVNQSLNVIVLDYSGISNVSVIFNSTVQNIICTSNSISWNCSWSLGVFTLGNYNFSVNYTDNFTLQHSSSSTYNFSVISCSDGSQNGDETGTDCGGSCSACSSSSSSSSSSGGGSGGGGGGSGGVTTYILSDNQIKGGYISDLKKGDKLKFKIDSEDHTLTFESMTAFSVMINVSSRAQRVLLSLGDLVKFDLNEDKIYDLSVKLNSINSSALKAGFTIKQINEAKEEIKTTIGKNISKDQNPISTKKNLSEINKENITSITSGKWWDFSKQTIIVGLILFFVLILIIYFLKKKKKKSPSKEKYRF